MSSTTSRALLTVCFLVGLLVASSEALHIKSEHSAEMMVGGYSDVDLSDLSEDEKSIDNYLKNYFVALKDMDLVEAQSQVVSGVNYRFTYADRSNPEKMYQFTVYDQPWTNTRELTQAIRTKSYTNDNGERVTAETKIEPNRGLFIDAVHGLFE